MKLKLLLTLFVFAFSFDIFSITVSVAEGVKEFLTVSLNRISVFVYFSMCCFLHYSFWRWLLFDSCYYFMAYGKQYYNKSFVWNVGMKYGTIFIKVCSEMAHCKMVKGKNFEHLIPFCLKHYPQSWTK